MIRPIALATAVLVATAIPALAQSGNPPATPREPQPSRVLGLTGTMYDGDNANLQLPSEQNAYWARLWAEPGMTGTAGSASAGGAGAAGTSLGGARTGGDH